MEMTTTLQWLAVGVASLAFASSLRRTWISPLDLVWTAFCASVAVMFARSAVGGQLDPMVFALLGLLGSFTCSVYWLIARGLFRGPGSIAAPQWWLAGGIAALLMGRQLLVVANAQAWIGPGWFERSSAALTESIVLLSSTVLVVAFWEALRGYGPSQGAERRWRLGFMLVYGGAVVACMVLPQLLASGRASELLHEGVSAISASAILCFTHAALAWRRRHPLAAADEAGDSAATPAPEPERSPTHEDLALAARLHASVERHGWYLEPELKVAELAERLGVPEYRVSRAICGALGAANFNQWINGYRIEHASRRLADPRQRRQPILSIAMASGFASLGPFNRAFKAQTGQTPSAFRQQAQARGKDTEAGAYSLASGR